MNPSSISSLLNPMDVEPSPRIVESDTFSQQIAQDADNANLTASLEKKVNWRLHPLSFV